MVKIVLSTAVFLSAALWSTSAWGYELFSDRLAWETALSGSTFVTEEFNLPDQSLEPLPFQFPSGLIAEATDFLGGSAIRDNSLVSGLSFPGSLDRFAFPSPVIGFGFDFNVLEGDKSFFLNGVFGEIPLEDTGFFGVITTEESSLIERFEIISSGELGAVEIDDLSFTSVPEPSSSLSLLSVVVATSVLKVQRKR
ncbi:hypothetical protein [Gloeocapsa sp. PCC 73106]|uniref:hypothetical protein n=1 Tax=Gloeocapsa sp. PCC 73106 TaxID=102232 RepID=UPI0002ABEF6A|nr:hypothetical protein [Gloeocapsa sp. PCC 73106]ELR99573.1 hypothetical protein GLO73106DRAFT_00034250 [Gloeocapsa sp. PCC 73106]